MARPFLADPHFVKKAPKAARTDQRIACNQACLDSFSDRPVGCVVNQKAGRETNSGYASRHAKVAVVGGAAGMATAAGRRG